jgi:GH25 family lysozyme M1 (1,4-beta-N-acetylmuramidase)
MYQIFRGATKDQDRGYNPDLTWGQVDFAIAKIGEGLNTPYRTKEGAKDGDRDFRLLWDGVSKIDIRGVYFYQRSGMSWRAQADGVLEYLRKLEVKPHMVWLDVEKINNVIDKTMIADAKNIMDYWRKELPMEYTVGLYANPDVVNNYIVPIGTRNYGKDYVDAIMKYPQWLAQYWFIKSPDKQPATYKGYPNWDLYQYSDKGDSFDPKDKTRRHYGSPDLNVYNGTVAEMKAWLKITETPTTNPSDKCPCCGRPF